MNWWEANHAALGCRAGDIWNAGADYCARYRRYLALATIVLAAIAGWGGLSFHRTRATIPMGDYPILRPGGVWDTENDFIVRLPSLNELPEARGI